jgi:hypothetical protein
VMVRYRVVCSLFLVYIAELLLRCSLRAALCLWPGSGVVKLFTHFRDRDNNDKHDSYDNNENSLDSGVDKA